MKKNIICIIGLGYVGLPVAVALSKNYKVIGYDKNSTRMKELKNCMKLLFLKICQ